MRRLFILLTAAVLVLVGAGAALADSPSGNPGPPADHPGHGKGLDNHAKGLENRFDRAVDRIDICHFDEEDGSYHVISIAEPALEAHLAHGDAFGVTFDDENRKGNNGRLDCTSITPFEEAFELDPQKVLDNGGIYDNPEVANAISEGFSGEVSVSFVLDTDEVVFAFTFENLPAGETFKVYLDSDGGSPGPWTMLGTFVVDGSGEGTFYYTAAPGPGTYTWSFWVNQPNPPASVLQTDDIVFTIE